MNKEEYKEYVKKRLTEMSSRPSKSREEISTEWGKEYHGEYPLTPKEHAAFTAHPHGQISRVLAQHLNVAPSLELADQLSHNVAAHISRGASPEQALRNSVEGYIHDNGGDRFDSVSDNYPSSRTASSRAWTRVHTTLPGEGDEDPRHVEEDEDMEAYERFVGDLTDTVIHNHNTGNYEHFHGEPPSWD